jgi:hypothetical protein
MLRSKTNGGFSEIGFYLPIVVLLGREVLNFGAPLGLRHFPTQVLDETEHSQAAPVCIGAQTLLIDFQAHCCVPEGPSLAWFVLPSS